MRTKVYARKWPKSMDVQARSVTANVKRIVNLQATEFSVDGNFTTCVAAIFFGTWDQRTSVDPRMATITSSTTPSSGDNSTSPSLTSSFPELYNTEEGLRKLGTHLRSLYGVKVRAGIEHDKRVEYFKGIPHGYFCTSHFQGKGSSNVC